ncbi:hypothetical protein [Streptomyces griseus]|uniref:hypothetical protein n=1 Tax=Streptomyces griseus TaxID=1911 RepID=UPI0038187373
MAWELSCIDGVEDAIASEEQMLAHTIAKVAEVHSERILMVMLGLGSIREAAFLFCVPNRLTP